MCIRLIPQVLKQGVICKEWQRTPMQLLSEYCQSKQRKLPKYIEAKCSDESKFRMRCVLYDGKNPALNLSFCSEQEYNTQDEAKHASALLGLFYLQPGLPLERKLPDPFRALWLSLTDQKDGKSLEGGQLTTDRKHACKADAEQEKRKHEEIKSNKRREKERRNQKMPHKEVFMSAQCREMIEKVLKDLDMNQKQPLKYINGVTEADNTGREIDGSNAEEMLRLEFETLGFQSEDINGAMRYCRETCNGFSGAEVATTARDWLFLNVKESDLPATCNPVGTQLDVIVQSQQKSTKLLRSDLSAFESVLHQRITSYGCDLNTTFDLVDDFFERDSGEELRRIDPSTNPEALVSALGDIWSCYFDLILAKFMIDRLKPNPQDQQDEGESHEILEDELSVLDSIYGEKILINSYAIDPKVVNDKPGQTSTRHCNYHITIQSSEEIQVEMFLLASNKYPDELPLLALRTTKREYKPYLIAASGELLQSVRTLLGGPILYDLAMNAEGTLSRLCASGKSPTFVAYRSIEDPPEKSSPSFVSPPRVVHVNERLNLPVKEDGDGKRGKRKAKQSPQPRTKRFVSYEMLQIDDAKKMRNPKFKAIQEARSSLPAAQTKSQFLDYLNANQVVMVSGQTGCGKSTQIPQFILENCLANRKDEGIEIVCTQPRRIAAIGVASRVADERMESLGDVVGYQIRMDSKRSDRTKLLFCTTGILFRRLMHDRLLDNVGYILVDEVHERAVDTDLLLAVLRDLLPKRPDIRIILMSATMKESLFVSYFSGKPVPVMHIPGFTYPVKTYYLEDMINSFAYRLTSHKLDKIRQASGYKSLADYTTQELIAQVDQTKIDYGLILHMVEYLVQNRTKGSMKANVDHDSLEYSGGAILIFLPGQSEIKRMMDILLDTAESPLHKDIWVVPLHGNLSPRDQAMVFQTPPQGRVKVIVSTNVAETSITVNDVTVVIDSGKVKEMSYDCQQRRSKLTQCSTSKASCQQRQGRAGRVQAGYCFRIFSKAHFEQLEPQISAEIHRTSLQQVCLQIKALGFPSIRTFLMNAIEPPQSEAIDSAIGELIEIGALDLSETSQDSDTVELTPLGKHLGMLPLDARIGKFLIYGSILGCVSASVTIAACISSKSPFCSSAGNPSLQEKHQELKRSVGGDNWKSDHLLHRMVVERYLGLSKATQSQKRSFCREYAVSFEALEAITSLRQQYLMHLETIGFYSQKDRHRYNINATVPRIIKAALCAGLYGNVVQVYYPRKKYTQTAHGVLTEEPEANQVRYFVSTKRHQHTQPDQKQLERVYLHPSSCNFKQSNFESPWILYTELIQTSRSFARDTTMINPFALLLFGGKLDVQHSTNVLVIDDWIHFAAVARIGVLIKAIRKQLDSYLEKKLANPSIEIGDTDLLHAIMHLLKTEGM
uniref:ATPdependent RNA helicase putative n=1 Tax=Albugo laibachii Nc14 TaxID=890382 RepID=F0WFF5_9STRA|nr:ATPdependent RNA helicase putative [Albugo laibachii Nc14]|eukprot:CCA19937.1 ATPdependent RNA helicase putative [Albugo laibachii Nc14]